jgi:hypothetical protein
MRAASGSCQILNSATGVTLPVSRNAPPIKAKRFGRRGNSGSSNIAAAILVSGPVATRTNSHAWSRAAARIASIA